MKRGELKQLIKECLIEILAEGIGAERLEETIQRTPQSFAAKPKTPQPQAKPKYNPALDQKVAGRQMIIPKKSKEDIMSSIMEETQRAMAEINEQNGFGDPLPAAAQSYSDPAAPYGGNEYKEQNYKEQFHGDPLAIFGGGGASAMWQKAAFGTPRPK